MMASKFKKSSQPSAVDLSEITIHFQTSFIEMAEDGTTSIASFYNYMNIDREVIDFLLLANGKIPRTSYEISKLFVENAVLDYEKAQVMVEKKKIEQEAATIVDENTRIKKQDEQFRKDIEALKKEIEELKKRPEPQGGCCCCSVF